MGKPCQRKNKARKQKSQYWWSYDSDNKVWVIVKKLKARKNP